MNKNCLAPIRWFYHSKNLISLAVRLIVLICVLYQPLRAQVNLGFESGNFNGWQGTMQNRNIPQNADRPLRPGPVNNGFLHHCIMNAGMLDPLIPTLRTVPPGKNSAARLGNTVSGGHIASLRQTFRVDSSNMIFSYSYAVVLEDPVDENGNAREGHEGLDRPHFQARLLRADGSQIECAEYTVVVATALNGFRHQCVRLNQNDEPNNGTDRNVGCPSGRDGNNPARASQPTDQLACGNGFRDMYYKDWSTIAVALNDYIGQNVTIDFLASDCIPNGHRGYAYVYAEAKPLDVSKPGTICPGKEIKQVVAPAGFDKYAWVGPGITSTSDINSQTISIDKPGTYTVTLTPLSDNPCPVTINYVAKEFCPILAYKDTLCATTRGSAIAEVNLTTYNATVTREIAPATVAAWHKAFPANASNRLLSATKVNVSDGDRFYAVTSAGRSDTVELSFKINPKPNILFPEILPVCLGSAPFRIANVTPMGGIFSGPSVTPQGLFTPSVQGNFNIQYKFTNPMGCVDSITKVATVDVPPTVSAGPDIELCYTGQPIPLNGSATNASTVNWDGGYGNFIPSTSPVTQYQPALEDFGAQPLSLKISTLGTNSCEPAEDSLLLTLHTYPRPRLDDEYKFCDDTVSSIQLDPGGDSLNTYQYLWSPGQITSRNLTVSNPGSYNVTVTSEGNCVARASTTVKIVCPPELYVADAFSPNSDAKNEVYHVYGKHIGKFQLYIFNRWGEVIYESNHKENTWDGTYMGEDIQMGVYPWIITYEGDSREYLGPYHKEGSVTVVR